MVQDIIAIMKGLFVSTLIVSLLLFSIATAGCRSPEVEGFSIYLTKQDTPVSDMPVLSHYELADEPIISMDDIISYTREAHEIELTPDAYDRISNLKVPTSGTAFVVCLDGKPVYWGAFWVMWSSQSFNGVTIMLPLIYSDQHVIQLQLGYPSQSLYDGKDPRSNPEILKSLEKAGKLK